MESLAACGIVVVLCLIGGHSIVIILRMAADPPEDVSQRIAYMVAAMAGFSGSIVGLFTIAIYYIFKGYGL